MKKWISLIESLQDDEVIIAQLESHKITLADILNPSERVQIAAVGVDFHALKYVKHDQSPVAQLMSVTSHPFAAQWLINPSEEVQLKAVEGWALALKHIDNPTEKTVERAVNLYGPSMLRDVQVPLTHELVAAAIKGSPSAIIEQFSELPVDLQHMAYAISPMTYPALAKLTNLDPDLTVQYQRYARDHHKALKLDRSLPMVDPRRPLGDVNQDQMVLLRWFELNERDSITVKELKKQPWGNTPYMQQLVRSTGGRDITSADVKTLSGPLPRQDLMRKAVVHVSTWEGAQRIFDERNRVCIYGVQGSELENLLTDPQKQLLDNIRLHGGHPVIPSPSTKSPHGLLKLGLPTGFSPKVTYTIGWVRFTAFDWDIWIDEVQSDLTKRIEGAEGMEVHFKGIHEAILIDFIRRMRRRGARRFFMPTFEMKQKLYGAEAPASIYTDLPRKMRMHKAEVTNVDPVVDHQEAWLLESELETGDEMLD